MLKRGVNLAYEYVQNTQTMTEKDWQRLVNVGIDHIRLPFRPVDMFTSTAYTAFNPTIKANYDALVQAGIAHGISVIIDCHDIDPTAVANSYNGLVAIWTLMGNTYKNLPVADAKTVGVYFEIFNEPQDSDPTNWTNKHNAAVTALRGTGATHWIIVDGLYGADPNGFDALSALADPKIFYSFHFYENYEFSHCGAEWTGMNGLSGIRYPSVPQQVNTKLKAIGNTGRTVSRYIGYMRENMLEQVNDHPVSWAETRGVPLYCGEGGFYNKHTRLEDGYAWMQDYIWTMSQAGVGYCLFVYGAPDGSWPIDDTILGMVQAERSKNRNNDKALYFGDRPISELNPLPSSLNVHNRRASVSNPVPIQMGNGSYRQFDYGIERNINYSVIVAAANPYRKGFSIQNQSSTATGWLRIDNGADATKDGWSWKLAPGKSFPEGPISVAPTDRISLISDQVGTPSTGDTYHHFNCIEIT